MAFKVPNDKRVRAGRLASDDSAGNAGAFRIKLSSGYEAFAIASNALGWEHVSVSLKDIARTPTWAEMCEIKAQFWGDEDTVLQYHPAKVDYVNVHANCLHLWRPVDVSFPLPPTFMV